MTHIVLDTSVLVPDYRMRSAPLRAVLRAASELGDTVAVPCVVIDELVNKFREDVLAASDALARADARIRSLLGGKDPAANVDVTYHVDAYRSWLRDSLKVSHVRELEYPSGSHRDLVARALRRRKPFSADGQRGYRDALIWETVLREPRIHRSETFFVSKNTRDFADPEDNNCLHPDLLSDLEANPHGPARLLFFPGLEELLARGIAPRQAVLPEIRAELDQGRLGSHELQPWLTEMLPSALNKATSRWHFQSLRQRHDAWAIGRLHSLEKPRISSTSTLTDRSILIVLLVDFMADLVPRQLELGLDVALDYGIENPTRFFGFINLEVELGTRNVLAVTADRLVALEQKRPTLGPRG